MSGGGSGTTTQKFEPPGYTQQPWQDLVAGAQGLTSQPFQQYQGMQVAPMTGQQIQAQNFAQDRALNGAPDLNAGRGAAMNVANGQYFNNSPWTNHAYTQNVIDQNAAAMGNAAAIGQNAQDDAMFSRSGAYGGSAWQQKQGQNSLALNNAVGNMANNYQLQNANMGNQNYMQGVNQMLAGGQLGGQLSQDDWTAANYLSQIGNQNQTYLQNLLGNSQQNFNQQQNWPYQQLQQLMSVLGGASGTGGMQTQNPYAGGANILTGLLGAGTAGLAGYQALH